MPQPGEIRVPGLQKLDVLEMADEFPPNAVKFTEEALPGGKHGELGTVAVVLLSGLAINALAGWLLKNRTKNRIRKTVEVVDASGKRRTETLDIDLSSSMAPKADVLNALAKITGFDLKKLLEPEA